MKKKQAEKNTNEPLNYKELDPKKHFNHNFPLREKKDILAVRYANLIFICLKKIVKTKIHLPHEELIDCMQEAVMAIPRHYCDHENATKQFRIEAHVLCNPEWCNYQKDPENYTLTKDYPLYIKETNTMNEPCNDAMKTCCMF